MSAPWTELVRGALAVALELLVFRAAPPLAFMLVTSAASVRGRAIAVGLYAALLGGLFAVGVPLERAAIGALPSLAFGVMAVIVYRLRGPFADGTLTRAGLFAICLLGFQLVPSLLTPERLLIPMIVIGWDLTLSGYSYVVDTASRRTATSLEDCLFFLLVNPTLVYAERGRQLDAPALRPAALLRVALGVLSVMAYAAVPLAIAALVPWLLTLPAALYFAWLAHCGGQIGAIALSHSGLASMQIGLMRLLGYEIPERYAFPLLAASPQEFWRRWNIWVGQWAQRYVFLPLALTSGRSFRRLPPVLAKGIAALATFLLLGALHDVFRGLQVLQSKTEPLNLHFTWGFLLFGVMFVVWLGVQRPVDWLRRRLRVAPSMARALGWVAFMHLLLLALYLTKPGGEPLRFPGLIDP